MSVKAEVMLTVSSNQFRVIVNAADLMRSFGGKLLGGRSLSLTSQKKFLEKDDIHKMLGRKPLKQLDSNGK